MSRGLLAAGALSLAACQLVAPFDPAELGCPCAEGYLCGEDDRCHSVGDGLENTTAACRDRLDNDQDGRVDCNDPDCLAIGACDEYQADCDPFTLEGCAGGLACFLTRGTDGRITTVCRVSGLRHVGQACERSGAPAETCIARSACVLPGTNVDAICQALCRTDADCGEHALCALDVVEVDYGLCTTPCYPWQPTQLCPGGYACHPVTVDASDRTAGGVVTTCLHPSALGVVGELGLGSPCDPFSRHASARCVPELICAPIAPAGGDFCVSYCDAAASSQPSDCPPCLALNLGGEQVRVGESVVGVCYGDAPH